MTNESELPPPAPPPRGERDPWKIFGIAMIALVLAGGAVVAGYFLGSAGDDAAVSFTSNAPTSTDPTTTTSLASSTTEISPTTTEIAPTTTRWAQRDFEAADVYRDLFESWRTDIPALYELYDDWEAFKGDATQFRLSPEIFYLVALERSTCENLTNNDLTFDFGRQTFGPLDNFMNTGIDISAEQRDKDRGAARAASLGRRVGLGDDPVTDSTPTATRPDATSYGSCVPTPRHRQRPHSHSRQRRDVP